MTLLDTPTTEAEERSRRSRFQFPQVTFGPPGTTKITVRVPDELLAEIREVAGRDGVGDYVVNALRLQRERDRLNELVAWLEAEHGPLTDEELAAGQRELDEIRARHRRRQVELRERLYGGPGE